MKITGEGPLGNVFLKGDEVDAGPSSNTTNVTSTSNTTNATTSLKPAIKMPFIRNSTGIWVSGKATSYGPFPSRPYKSEIGYVANDIGVGCSNGQPGGDPHWNLILAQGTYPNPNLTVNADTVWPQIPTVAVSQRKYGGDNKNQVCFQPILIRNKNSPEKQVEAVIVDFCPTQGCLWSGDDLSRNADIYGENTWTALGAGLDDGSIEVEIQWPAGVVPNNSRKSMTPSLPILQLAFILFVLFRFLR
ncbi:hypothetical protein HDU97_008065 [Phlyctochytrium planicorne]|nr:hypothetical protein HDU97_008065 [Phlyctochytrium planicorne]